MGSFVCERANKHVKVARLGDVQPATTFTSQSSANSARTKGVKYVFFCRGCGGRGLGAQGPCAVPSFWRVGRVSHPLDALMIAECEPRQHRPQEAHPQVNGPRRLLAAAKSPLGLSLTRPASSSPHTSSPARCALRYAGRRCPAYGS